MRGLDALAAACTPQTTPDNTGEMYAALSDDQCKKIAAMVLEQLQNAQQPKSGPDQTPDQALEPEAETVTEEGAMDYAESES